MTNCAKCNSALTTAREQEYELCEKHIHEEDARIYRFEHLGTGNHKSYGQKIIRKETTSGMGGRSARGSIYRMRFDVFLRRVDEMGK